MLELITKIINENKLSLKALSLYLQMVILPERDYVTWSEIKEFCPHDKLDEIRDALDELNVKLYIIYADNDGTIFAVNKSMLPKLEEEE